MKTAPLTPDDSLRLAALWNRSAAYNQVDERLFQEKIWGDVDYRQDLGLVIYEASEPIALALGVARHMVIEFRGYIKLLAVEPEYQRRGIARSLVEQLEAKLRQSGVAAIRVGESAPNYLFPGVDTRYTSAIHLFETLGYERVGKAHNLVVEIAGKDFNSHTIEEILRTNGFDFRRATHEDSEAIDKLIARYWLAWRSEIATALGNQPISMHIALKEDEIVGFSVYDSNNLGTGWFGPMGTQPECRGMGIGRVLMLRCLQDLQEQGHQTATIAWVSPTSLYAECAGAKLDRTFIRYEKRFVPLPDAKSCS